MRLAKRYKEVFCVFCLAVIAGIFVNSNSVFGIAKQSTISVSLQSGTLALQLAPTPEGVFGESSSATISVTTDNYTGYNLSLVSSSGTSLVNANDVEVESISSNVTAQAFATNSAYNNKWGFKPSQYVSSSGGVDTVVNNTDFVPAPSGDGLMIDKTSAANSVANTYSLSFGARADTTLPAGSYSGTYVLVAIANSIVFNVTYDDNTTDVVTNMPTPNPQVTSIDGGTPVADSYVTLSDAVPVRNEKKFAGWCDVATTPDSTTGDDTCSGTLYQASDNLPVDQTAGPNITLYAVWVDTLFPIVWNQMGACTFNGATNGNITGSECEDYWDVRFIDTEVPLYSQANFSKDYEIHFTIDHYLPSEQVDYYGSEDNGQQTFVNDKLGSNAGDKKAPGVVVRRNGGNNIDINSKYSDAQIGAPYNYQQVSDVSVFRLDGTMYYSLNGGPLIFLQNLPSNYSQFFGLKTETSMWETWV